MKKNLLQTIKIILLGGVLGVGIMGLSVWAGVPATSLNASNNVAGALNIGPEFQTKNGGLSVDDGLASYGHVQVLSLRKSNTDQGGNRTICADEAGMIKICNQPSNICTGFTYSAWGTCTNGVQSRTILTKTPTSCTGGNAILTQSCGADTCTSFTYSDWSTCVNGVKARNVISKFPTGCTGGNPITTQSCGGGGGGGGGCTVPLCPNGSSAICGATCRCACSAPSTPAGISSSTPSTSVVSSPTTPATIPTSGSSTPVALPTTPATIPATTPPVLSPAPTTPSQGGNISSTPATSNPPVSSPTSTQGNTNSSAPTSPSSRSN